MATLTAPGVYVEEQASGVRPIEAAGTSTAAFFGETERGPVGSVVKIFNFTEFENSFGSFLDGGRHLAHAVFQFFNNGGSACYVGRVAPNSVAASVTVVDRAAAPIDSLTISASSPGAWGNEIMVDVRSAPASDPDNQFVLTVLRENPDPTRAPIVLETWPDLSMNPGDATFIETMLAGSVYVRAAVNPVTPNPNVIRGFSEGDVVASVAPVVGATQRIIRININNDGQRVLDLTAALAAVNLSDPVAVAAAIQGAIQALAPLRASTDPASYSGSTTTFVLVGGGPLGRFTITAGGAASRMSSVVVDNGPDPATNAAGALALGRKHGGREVFGSSPTRPADTPVGDLYLVGDDTVAGSVSAVVAGANGTTPQDSDYVAALPMIDLIRDVSLVAIPGIGSEAVIDAAMNYCANRQLSDCFYVGDLASSDDTYTEAIAFRDALNGPNSYGATYFPWVYMLDPTGRSAEPILAPPSGFMAGLYGRIDSRRGVWKAPAGSEAILAGAVGLATDIDDVQHGDLNRHPKSVCVIRRFPTTGIVSWGARTVSSDPEYKYISIRRTAIFLRVSIFNGIQWAVFEPNDEPLWASLRLNIGAFMNTLFRRGAFQGATPKEAYFVKCDAETTPQADRDLGIVNVLVGFAPLKPAEFVVVKIRQIAGVAP